MAQELSALRKISILVVLIGVLLPVGCLGFVEGYNPEGGFIWSLSRMEIVLREGIPLATRSGQETLAGVIQRRHPGRPRPGRVSVPYKYVLVLSCLMAVLGTAGVVSSPK